MKRLALLFALASSPAFATTALDVKNCGVEKAQETATDYGNRRGGECHVTGLTMSAGSPGYIAPEGTEYHVMSSKGKITLTCSGALFHPNSTFTRNLSVHVLDDGRCWGGVVGFQL
jgi:hypothetical protein